MHKTRLYIFIKQIAKTLSIALMVFIMPVVFAPLSTSILKPDTGLYVCLPTAFAEEDFEEEKTRKTPALRNYVYEKLSAAQQASEAGDIAAAVKILDKLKARSGKKALNSYELANLWNFYAFIYYSKDLYENAIDAYKNVLKQPDIPEAMEVNTKYSLAQLYFVIEDYNKAIEALENWFKVAINPSPGTYILLGQAYIQTKQYDKALIKIEQAIKVAQSQGKQIKENWYVLLRYLYNEKNDNPKQLEVLQILIKQWPKKEYWIGLAGMYGEMDQEDLQLHAMETAYTQGLLNRESELVSLAQMLAASGVPYKAAKIMDKGIKGKIIEPTSRNTERLGEFWRRAQETTKALPKLEKAAAGAENGEPYFRLAYIYYSLDRFADCVNAAQQALKKGGLRQPMEAQLLLGQSLFYEKQYDDARDVFKEILADTDKKNSRSRKTANQWLRYMEREIIRLEEIAKYLQP